MPKNRPELNEIISIPLPSQGYAYGYFTSWLPKKGGLLNIFAEKQREEFSISSNFSNKIAIFDLMDSGMYMNSGDNLEWIKSGFVNNQLPGPFHPYLIHHGETQIFDHRFEDLKIPFDDTLNRENLTVGGDYTLYYIDAVLQGVGVGEDEEADCYIFTSQSAMDEDAFIDGDLGVIPGKKKHRFTLGSGLMD